MIYSRNASSFQRTWSRGSVQHVRVLPLQSMCGPFYKKNWSGRTVPNGFDIWKRQWPKIGGIRTRTTAPGKRVKDPLLGSFHGETRGNTPWNPLGVMRHRILPERSAAASCFAAIASLERRKHKLRTAFQNALSESPSLTVRPTFICSPKRKLFTYVLKIQRIYYYIIYNTYILLPTIVSDYRPKSSNEACCCMQPNIQSCKNADGSEC